MTVLLKTDSDGYVHQLWAQEQASSCAVASIWMARNQARQQTVDESEWSLAWSLFSDIVQPMPLSTTPRPEPAPRTFNPSAYQSNQLTMGNMFANFGTFMKQVADKLRMDGLNAEHGWPMTSPRSSCSAGTTAANGMAVTSSSPHASPALARSSIWIPGAAS